MLVLSLRSGVGLGSFTLGCRINEALITARQNRDIFGCVELKYFEQASHKQDFILSLPEHGLHLVFDGSSQRLRLIEVFDLSRMQVKQGGATVGGLAHSATFEAVYDLAGPTYPGHVDSKHEVFVMHWPGLLILFPLSAQSLASWQDMQQGKALPAALASGTAPVACRMCLHASKAVTLDELAQARPPSGEAPPEQQLGFRLGTGLVLQDTQQELCFGDTPQDAWSALGAPSNTFTKDKISAPQGSFASPSLQQHSDAGSADYFYNYFDRGLDLLFCGRTHRLKKIVLHTNLPNHVSFGLYNKCCFLIHPPSSTVQRSTRAPTSDGGSAQESEVTGSNVALQQAQHAQQAPQMQQAQHAQQAQHHPQQVYASCQDVDEEQHTSALIAGDIGHERQASLLLRSQPPTQDMHHSPPRLKDLHYSQRYMRHLHHSQPDSEAVHDSQPMIEDERNDWRQQGSLPVAKWLNQAHDARGCVPELDCNAPGHMAGLDENAPGHMAGLDENAPGHMAGLNENAPGHMAGLDENAPQHMAGLDENALGTQLNVQQVLLKDIMALTRADSEAASSDSSQTQQRDLPCDANAGPSSSQALSARVAAASSSLDGEESTAQREQLQGNAEGLGHSTAIPSVTDGWGRGSQGGPAGGSNLDGWDDMDPMTLLSGSVQSQMKAQDSYFAQSAQPLMVQTCDSQARLPDEQLGAPSDSHDHQTNPAKVIDSVHDAPSMLVDRPDSSESQSRCKLTDSGHQGKGLDVETHLGCQVQGNSPITTSRAERDSAVLKDAHLGGISPASSVGHDSSQQSVTRTSLQDGDAQPETADGAASGACSSKPEGSVHMETAVLTAESSVTDVQSMLGPGDRAVIHTRAPGRDAFGPTLVYGYPGVVFEATQAGCIATVTLF